MVVDGLGGEVYLSTAQAQHLSPRVRPSAVCTMVRVSSPHHQPTSLSKSSPEQLLLMQNIYTQITYISL